jgi:putative membrane protein
MMPGYGNGMGGWGWIYMSLGTIVFVVLIGLVVWLLVRATGTSGGNRPAAPADSAREILAQRYARGEIDEQEHQQRLRTLGG